MIKIPSELFTPKKKDLKAISMVFGKAFASDALAHYWFPDVENRMNILSKIYRVRIKHVVKNGIIYCSSSRMEGAAMWIRCVNKKMSTFDLLVNGAYFLLFDMKWKYLGKLVDSVKYIEEIGEEFIKAPCWKLDMLGVIPQHQGQGYAGTLLRPMLKNIAAEGVPCYLETQNEKNIAIYTHFGFELVSSTRIPMTDVTNYIMIKNT